MAGKWVYPYNFPEINLDPQQNYPSAAGIIKKITAEEWADMLHHTHKITEITDNAGNKLGSGSDGTITAYDDTEVRNLISSLQSQLTTVINETIFNLQSQISTLTNENTFLKENINTLQSRVSEIENNGSGGSNTDGFIIDYDIDKEGTQDINGNNINN